MIAVSLKEQALRLVAKESLKYNRLMKIEEEGFDAIYIVDDDDNEEDNIDSIP